MKNKDPAFWAACRLHRILSGVSCRRPADPHCAIPLLLVEQQAVEREWRAYQKASSRGWSNAAQIVFRRLVNDIAAVHAASTAPRLRRGGNTPALGDILAEIRQLQDEFDGLNIEVREGRIEVTTPAITLEDISLGEFCIQLHLDRLARRQNVTAFVIVAEEANPASSDSSCTHPHVRDEALCAGEATAPISQALAEGRVGDAFQLINRVLHTYNPSSAYVSLDQWDGRTCGDCGGATSSNNLYFCASCQGDFCDNCIRTCERCDESICLGCLKDDEQGQRLCPGCDALAFDEAEEEAEEDEFPIAEDAVPDPSQDEQLQTRPQIQNQEETLHADSHCSSADPGPNKLSGCPSDAPPTVASPARSSPQAA